MSAQKWTNNVAQNPLERVENKLLVRLWLTDKQTNNKT
jgi:hypothetical protein